MGTVLKSTVDAHQRNEALPAIPEAIPSSPHRSPLTLESPELYFNRELSLLEFQKRVLEQAQDPLNPLLERVKFL